MNFAAAHRPCSVTFPQVGGRPLALGLGGLVATVRGPLDHHRRLTTRFLHRYAASSAEHQSSAAISRFGRVVPKTDNAWLTALAWLTRDQECRFDDPLDWRAVASGSDSPVRHYAVAESLLAVRALIGAFTRDEQILRETISKVEQQTASALKEVEHRTWQTGLPYSSTVANVSPTPIPIIARRPATEPIPYAVHEAASSTRRPDVAKLSA